MKESLLKFTGAADPFAGSKKQPKLISGLSFLDIGEVLSIKPVNKTGKVIDFEIEIPLSNIPALIETLQQYSRQPQTMLMLEILHECPDAQEAGYEYTEAWPYQDTPEGLAAARTAIQGDIERCKEDPDAPPFVNARIWRCTANQYGAYTDAEEVVTVNLYQPDEPEDDICPYRQEILNEEYLCRCTEKQRQNCRDDI